MSFWRFQDSFANNIATLEGESPASSRSLTYAELGVQVDSIRSRLPKSGAKQLGFIYCQIAVPAISAYLAALSKEDAVALLSGALPESLRRQLEDTYKPDWIVQHGSIRVSEEYSVSGDFEGWRMLTRMVANPIQIHGDIAVLLPTSGTTGSPKMVRLSYKNLQQNAASIASYLDIKPTDRAITTLPIHYSYGLSVINSHLLTGAGLIVTEASLLAREFWKATEFHQATSMSGVPYTYQMLHRLNPKKLPLESIKVLTQAGGRLDTKLIEYFARESRERDWKFFVMYGQTEAAPRISYVPPDFLAGKIGSIGIPIPGGKLSITSDGELCYEGPNVMMGYATCREHLAKGDEQNGRLLTGDLATKDADGFFYITGRRKRFIKIHGNRISLDEVEQYLEDIVQESIAVLGEDDMMIIFTPPAVKANQVEQLLIDLFRLHPTTFRVRRIGAIPFTESGKKNYAQLQS